MFRNVRFFIAIIGSLLIFACGRERSKGGARIQEIRLPGAYADCLFADFDGDSRLDILALTVGQPFPDKRGDAAHSRRGAIIIGADSSYQSSQAALFDIPPGAVVFDTGDIDGDGAPEILFISPDGLYALEYSQGAISAPRRVISQNTLFHIPIVGSVSRWDFYRSVISRGRSLIFLPCCAGIIVYGVEGGKIDSLGMLNMQYQVRASTQAVSEMNEANSIDYTCSLPTIQTDDYNGDALDDIFMSSQKGVMIYPGELAGTFASNPEVTFGTSMASGLKGSDSNSEVQFQIKDLNGDGRADIVATKTAGGVTRFESEIGIYFARARGGYDEKPSFVRKTVRSAGMAYLNDINGDGRTDLVIPALKLGVMPMLKMLILNRLDIDINIYLQGGGIFPEEPSLRKSVSATVDINTGNINFANNMAFGGDYNGDHLSDFLLDSGKGDLKIFYGAAGSVLNPKYGWSLEFPHPSSIYPKDLNDDGRSEILAFYGPDSPDRDMIRVIWVNPNTNPK